MVLQHETRKNCSLKTIVLEEMRKNSGLCNHLQLACAMGKPILWDLKPVDDSTFAWAVLAMAMEMRTFSVLLVMERDEDLKEDKMADRRR